MDKGSPLSIPERASSKKSSKHELQRMFSVRLPTPPPDPTSSETKTTEKSSNAFEETCQQNVPNARMSIIKHEMDHEAMDKESEFLEYLLSLPNPYAGNTNSESKPQNATATNETGKHPLLTRSTSIFAQTMAADDAFDHLDKLYKLMEQLLNLREQNSKLQKRVRDLEHYKNLQDMHLQVEKEFLAHGHENLLIQDLEADPGFTESLLDTMLAAGRNASNKRSSKLKSSGGQSRFRNSLLRKPRDRSCSMAVDDLSHHLEDSRLKISNFQQPRRASGIETGKPSKVSKWTKVKAAFKWEKASTGVTWSLPGAKSQDSGLGGMLPINTEVARYLKVPTCTVTCGTSPNDSALSGQSSPRLITEHSADLSVPATPASLSSASSVEDIRNDVSGAQFRGCADKLRQRLSTCSDGEDIHDPRRSKSFDEDIIGGTNNSSASSNIYKDDEQSNDSSKHINKGHRTPWGKVKDIIQTRKDSLKKSRHRTSIKLECNQDAMKISENYEVDEDADYKRSASSADVCSITDEQGGDFPDVFENSQSIAKSQSTTAASLITTTSTNNDKQYISKKPAPLLTLTIQQPSNINDRQELSPDVPKYKEEPGNTKDDEKTQYKKLSRQESSDTETSPIQRRNSKWTRVKKVFLTSPTPSRSDTDSRQASMSLPSSPVRFSSFFGDNETEEINENACENKPKRFSRLQSEYGRPHCSKILQEEIRKNYEELQNKLSLEFQEKLQEWERIKAQNVQNQLSANAVVPATPNDHVLPPEEQVHDVEFQKKIDEWEKIKHQQTSAKFNTKETTGILTKEENLSADFKKKLQDWQKMRKCGSKDETYAASSSNSQSKKKLTDWQLWKSLSTTSYHKPLESGLPSKSQLSEDFLKKLEEWKHMKATNTVPSYNNDDDDYDNKTPSPRLSRKNSGVIFKSPRQSKKSKGQDETEWLEKELQSIERDKHRLEKEKEKYLDREERISKLRRSVGASQQKKEVLVQTSTGFYRFEGISRKFTRRLYEWEKAKGIGPEESTLSLLSPAYRPPITKSPTRSGIRDGILKTDNAVPGKLVRSKSVDSVANLTAASAIGSPITHQPSSLSLNDVEELETECLGESRLSSEPYQMHQLSDHGPVIESERLQEDDNEPEAVIVDVEDVVEETAAPLEALKDECRTHIPVYKYAQQDIDSLCEGEECLGPKIQGNDSSESHPTYNLIEENISLLNKLKDKEELCRQLETGIEDLQGEMNSLTETQYDEIEKLQNEEREEINRRQVSENLTPTSSSDCGQRRVKIRELERRRESLKREGVTLQKSFAEHSEQQAKLARHLVGRMKLLNEVNAVAKLSDGPSSTRQNIKLENVAEIVQDLSTELLTLAEKLELALADRNNEIRNLRSKLNERQLKLSNCGKQWNSVELASLSENNSNRFLPPQSSSDAKELPFLLTSKILELKRGLSYLCTASDTTVSGRHKKVHRTESEPARTYSVYRNTVSEESRFDISHEHETKLTTDNILNEEKGQTAFDEDVNKINMEAKENSSTFNNDDLKVLTANIDEMTTSLDNPQKETTLSITITPKFMKKKIISKKMSIQDSLKISEENHNEDITAEAKLTLRKHSQDENDQANLIEPKHSSDVSSNVRTLDESCKNVSKNIKPKSEEKVKRKTKTRPKSSPESCSDDEECNDAKKNNKSRKLLRSKRILESRKSASQSDVRIKKSPIREPNNSEFTTPDPVHLERNVLISANHQFVDLLNTEQKSDPPTEVIVKTTRKLFTPISFGDILKEDEVKIEETQNTADNNSDIASVLSFRRSRSPSDSPALPRKKRFTEVKQSFAANNKNSCAETNSDITENKTELPVDLVTSSSCNGVLKEPYVTKLIPLKLPTATLPPLPNSPTPLRRERLFSKETAPSIRLMIARYNQRLTEQDGGKSPGGSSGSASPVAWRSPVAERRVRAQTEKYQEEVRRVLQQGRMFSQRQAGTEITKSASAGVIRTSDSTESNSPKLNQRGLSLDPNNRINNPSNKLLKGILKSSSIGSFKTDTENKNTPSEEKSQSQTNNPNSSVPDNKLDLQSQKNISSLEEKGLENQEVVPLRKNDVKIPDANEETDLKQSNTPPKIIRKYDTKPPSPKLLFPLPPESVKMSPLSKIRAARIQQAKEEFLTRNATENSCSTASSPSPSQISNLQSPLNETNMILHRNRLSQISCGSESSCDDINADRLLIKSASAGMINVDADTFNQLLPERHSQGYVSLPRSTKAQKQISSNRFGISSITSKFRKVKMRRNKDKDANKMDTVSMLCRQSLMVDINDSCVSSTEHRQEENNISKSSSSPGFHNQNSNKDENCATGHSWLNKTKIFKPK